MHTIRGGSSSFSVRLLALSAGLLCSFAPASPARAIEQPIAGVNGSARTDTRAALSAILDEQVRAMLEADPISASIRGHREYNRLLPDPSPEGVKKRYEATVDRLARLQSLDRAGWSEEDNLNADLLITMLKASVSAARFHPEQLVIDDRDGAAVNLPQVPDRLPIRTAADREDYVARLEMMGVLIDRYTMQARAGLLAGRVPPRVAVAHVVAQARGQCSAEIMKDAALSPFYKPLDVLDPADPLAVRAREAIVEGIAPAFARMAEFLEKEYVPKCRDSVAAKDSVDGLAYYEHELLRHTTTQMTADQIHRLGLREVARIKAEMLEVIPRTGFDPERKMMGDQLLAAFLNDLRTNPRFYFTKPEDLLNGYRVIAKRIDAELPRFFGTLPRNPYGIREIPRAVGESSPTAYYYEGSMKAGVPGYFMANTYRLDQRPRYEMIPLTLHEAMPGHHLQVAIAQELESVHPVRRMLDFTVFVEGWGLYAERLGLEMAASRACTVEGGEGRKRDESRGFFADPYDDFGRLTYEMWRATRLVVDTGIHAKGWSRQQAIDYMLAHTGLSKYNIEREVDRYIAWPGQACAYKIGELKIRELRERAEKALGSKFDIRAFHDHLLGGGPVSLDALEARMNRWIESRK